MKRSPDAGAGSLRARHTPEGVCPRAASRGAVQAFLAVLALLWTASPGRAADQPPSSITKLVDGAIKPLMAQYGIPGCAVGLVVDGTPYTFDYGVASLETRAPVTAKTLFEAGSVSKTLTVTLATYAQARGALSMSDTTSTLLPALRGTPFGGVTLINLATHTTGGLPLQVPDTLKTMDDVLGYLAAWQPARPPGTVRTYANLSIGLLGAIAAKSLNEEFTTAMQADLFPLLGMSDTFIRVPAGRSADYAQGYTKDGRPIRKAPGTLDAEAYGVVTTRTDLMRFMEANMGLPELDGTVATAVDATHVGYYQDGGMTQDLIWEQYPYPVTLDALIEGNGPSVAFAPTPVVAIRPPMQPREDVWINKTGSTDGFGAYIAFVPKLRSGIVILATTTYPIEARVTAAYTILSALAH